MKINVVNVSGSVNDYLQEISDIYKEFGIVVIRGLSFDKDRQEYNKIYPNNKHQYDVATTASEQFDLVKKLGDILGWSPNSEVDSWDDIIVENHSRMDLSGFSSEDTIICWHLEHVDYDMYDPLLASVWTMWHCDLDKDGKAGNTWFVDSEMVYKELSKKDQQFLSKCFLQWYDIDGSGPHQAKAVVPHWLTKNNIIRIELTPGLDLELLEFDGRSPTNQEAQEFKIVFSKVMNIIENNKKIRLVHRWQKDDIVIPDLQRMAHTVTGGFSSKDRIFTNFFTYLKDPRKLKEEEKPLIWRKDWTEKVFGNQNL